jgi:hypothetical protein
VIFVRVGSVMFCAIKWTLMESSGTFAKSVVGGISTTTSDVNPCRIRLCGEAAGGGLT